MNTLDNNQILYISNDLKAKGLSVGFRSEALDHICCMVEEQMNQGHCFSNAYKLSLEAFGDLGFEELKQKSPLIKKKERTMVQQLTISTIAASIFVFVFNTSIADKPSLHPIDPAATVTSAFGLRLDPIKKEEKKHTGIDFKSAIGTPVRASGDGIIEFAQAHGRYGNKIVITHDEEYKTMYAHLNEIKVEKGQKVKKGDIIGTVGNTGSATGPHLHYEVLKNGEHVDPAAYLVE